jgi:hypothetical protein
MATSDSPSSPKDDDDNFWTEYIKKAGDEDNRLLGNGQGVIDGLLVFVRTILPVHFTVFLLLNLFSSRSDSSVPF